MKVYTKVVLDIASGDVLEESSFEYSGPVATATGGSSKGASAVPQLPGQAKFINSLRAGQEWAFDPFRAQARGLFGTMLDPYSSFQNPRAGFTAPAGTQNLQQLTRAMNQYTGTGKGGPSIQPFADTPLPIGTGLPPGLNAANGAMLPGFNWDVAPTPGTPEIPGSPFMSARDVARQAFLDQTGRTSVRDPRLDRFIRRQARLGNVFEDRPATEMTPATPGTPGILSQNPTDQGMRAVYDTLSGFGDLRFQTPEQAFAASQLARLTDVGSLESAAARNLQNIVGPQLLSSLTAQGLGRSGAVGEALSTEASRMALPIAQTAWQGQQNLANYINQLGQNRMNLIAQTAYPSQTGSPLTFVGGTGSSPSGGGGSMAGSILGGAATGASMGSMFGPWGTAIGGLAGGLMGGFSR